MSQLSLIEVAQSQLAGTPVVDGQIVCCLDTGNFYRDTANNRVHMGHEIEVVSSLPLAPITNKIYLLLPDELYWYNGDWTKLNHNHFSFSKIIVGDKTAEADETTDTLTLAAGENVTIVLDTSNDKITIAAKDTVYTHPSYTERELGLNRIHVDSKGHVDNVSQVTKQDIVALGIPAQDTTYNVATTSSSGLMSADDKTQLNTAYAHASAKGKAFASGLYKVTTNEHGHITAASAVTKSDITALGIPGQDTNTTYSNATNTADGLMSAADKAKLDAIEAEANKIVVDSSMSISSANPVQNRVVSTEIDKLNKLIGKTSVAEQITTETNKFIKGISASGKTVTYTYGDNTTGTFNTQDTTYSVVSTGQAGLAPARNGDGYSYLAGDGNWTKPPVMYVYSANFTAGSWLGDSTEGYIQTATITPVNGGPAVTETTQLSYPMGLPTGVKDTDAAIQAALDVINCGSSVPGNGTVTCTVWDAPETDVTVYWYGY